MKSLAAIALLTLGAPLAFAADRPAPGRAVTGDPANEIHVSNETLSGWLLDNAGNAGHDGGGFNFLQHAAYPGKSIFRDGMVGLNFEHIFNGDKYDNDISMFTPRRDPNYLVKHPGGKSGTLVWPAESSSWDVDCAMTYTFVEPDAIDMKFEATPREGQWPHGYLAFMWASYMNRTAERSIHFQSFSDGEFTWQTFGEDTDNEQGFETGTITQANRPNLRYHEGSKSLNIIEHPTKRFARSFYYGLLDGDHDLTTTNDRLAYIVMLEPGAHMRFALWNFIKDNNGNPDPHSPAWDWQYIIVNPKVDQTYGYRMRVVITPFTTREAILQRYKAWAANL